MFGATVVLVAIVALLTWPWAVGGSADERRVEDLQRLAHAIDAFRLKQHVLPSSLARLPREPAAPIHAYDPITNRLYDYRPLGPLAYELCARFDAASAERRDFWWHDAGRHCFALETREGPKPPSASPASTATPSADGDAPAEPSAAPAAPAESPATPPDTPPAPPPGA